MQRPWLSLRVLLATLVAVLGSTLLMSSPAQARSSIKVAIGDQSAAMFDDRNYQALKLKRTRYFIPWNAMKDPYQLQRATQYVEAARRNGVSVLMHLSTDNFTLKKAKLPSVKQYRTEVRKLIKHFKPLGVREWGVWNEANHASQPTYKNPKRAADFFKEMYSACKGCTIVALDVLDQGGVDGYQKRWYRSLSKTWRNRAKIVGIHNYGDVNRKRTTYTAKMIKASRGYKRNTKFWFTETGGLVEFGKSFKCSTDRAAARTKNVFSLAKRYKRQGVQRVYLYNWFGAGCGNTRQDAGIVSETGTPRKAYAVVKSQLKNYSR